MSEKKQAVCLYLLGPMNLNVTGITSLSDGPYATGALTGNSSNAVNGDSAIGKSYYMWWRFCAVNNYNKNDKLQFLRISLHHKQLVLFIRLHLRDSITSFLEWFPKNKLYRKLNGLRVEVGSFSNVNEYRANCGSPYNSNQGQSPTFVCNKLGSYVWLTLTANSRLEVCEVEVYAG